MLLGARTAAWAKSGGAPLPYDEEVEYLTSKGYSYIKTGITATNQLGFEIQYYDSGIQFNPAGSWGGGWLDGMWGIQNKPQVNQRPLVVWGSSHQDNINVYKGGDSPVVRMAHGSCHVNGILVSTLPDEDFVAGEIIIFGRSNRDGAVTPSACRVYYLKVFSNNGLVADFIPVRFTNSVGASEGAMYDRVSGQLFRNAGTGAFVIGPDKT